MWLVRAEIRWVAVVVAVVGGMRSSMLRCIGELLVC